MDIERTDGWNSRCWSSLQLLIEALLPLPTLRVQKNSKECKKFSPFISLRHWFSSTTDLQLFAHAMDDDDPFMSLVAQVAIPTARPSGTSGPARPSFDAAKPIATNRAALAARGNLPVTAPGVIPVTRPIEPSQASARSGPAPPTSRGGSFLRHAPSVRAPTHSAASGGPAAIPGRAYADLGQGSFIQRHSGLKVKNPLVSSAQLESRLGSASVVRLGQLRQRHHSGGLGGGGAAWATLVAVGEASSPRETTSGKHYTIWKLTDLDQTSVSLFLFGKAYDEWRRDARPGALIALITPRVRAEGGEFSLSVDSADQIMLLGTAAEFGFCEAKTKGGAPCRVPVNVSRCPFCSYHVTGEYNKVAPKGRMELQGHQLYSAFQPGMRRQLAWQPGKFQSAEAALKPRMPAATMQQLKAAAAAAAGRGGSSGARYVTTVADPAKAKVAAQELELATQRRNILAPGAAPIPLPRGATVVYQAPAPGKKRRGGSGGAGAGVKRVKENAEEDGEMVELENDDIFAGTEGGVGGSGGAAAGADAARQRALEVLRSRPAGGSAAAGVRNTKVPDFLAAPLRAKEAEAAQRRQAAAAAAKTAATQPRTQSAMAKKVASGAGPSRKPANTPAAAAAAPAATAFAAAFGSVIAEMEEAQATDTVPKGSMYAAEAAAVEDERLFATLDALERKDEMAAKMDSIKALQVGAWRCEVCACTTEYRPKTCGEQHPGMLKQTKATKRWWKCGGCGGRFSTVGVRYPAGRCPRCDVAGMEFTAVSMLRPQKQLEHEERQNGVAGRDKLSARGVEQRWVNQQ